MFTQSTFAPVGANSSNSPAIFSYTSGDDVATVTATEYFIDKRHQLREGDLIHAVLSDGTKLLQVQTDTATVNAITTALPADNFTGGFFDYNDLATQTTAISVTGGGGFVDLTNDELGAFTNKLFPPLGVADVWDASIDEFDWSELKLGDMIDIRLDVEVTTTLTNTELNIVLELGTGGGLYQIPFLVPTDFKTAGAIPINRYSSIYLGDTNTLNNGGKFRIQSDKTCTVKVNGWYCKVNRRGQ